MPLITASPYRPPAYLWNGHLQTVIPSLFRKIPIRYVRQRIETADADFLDLDWSRMPQTADSTPNPLVIISHGLEGDSSRQYVAGTVRLLNQHGFDCLAWHARSCSSEMNRLARFYHIGETGDLQTVIDHALHMGYTDISLVGFSAGGNVSLKYLGERGGPSHGGPSHGGPSHGDPSHGGAVVHPAIRRAVAISVPLDLPTTADRLEQWDSMVYNRRFQRTLKKKILIKAPLLPDSIRRVDLRKIKSLRQFDDQITAPLHGFDNADTYYRVNSSIRFVAGITVPTLVLNARNDPFLSPECFPEALARELTCVWMEFPRQGGHCGFPSIKGLQAPNYAEERIVQFLTRSSD